MFKSLEVVDDVIDSKDIEFVKISDEKIEVEFAVDKLPTLVYFENKIPIEYDGKKCNGPIWRFILLISFSR